MSTLTNSAARAGLIALLGLVVAACSSPATMPSDTPTAIIRPPASVPSSTAYPAITPVPQTPAVFLTPRPTRTVSTATPPPSATWDPWRFLPACCDGATPITRASLPDATSHAGWKHYTQPDYGLSLDVPPDWALAVGPHYLSLASAAAPTVGLTISFRGPIESVNIVRSGVAAGDIITRGTVVILGQKVDRDILVYQGKDKAVLYNSAAEVGTPQIALTASLDDFGTGDYDAVALPAAVQATADQIVATLYAGPPLATWLTYTSAAFHVAVQYPSNWHPDITGQALYSGPDGFFQITASESLGLSAVAFCQYTRRTIESLDQTDPAKAEMMGYGRNPTVETLTIDHQPACYILPSGDQPADQQSSASLFVDYPSALRPPALLMVEADKGHVRELGARLKFVRTP